MKTTLDPRHQKREIIIQQLFAWQEQSKLKLDHVDSKILDRKNWDEKTTKIISQKKEIDEIITFCAPEWDIDKINEIDLAILRLAVYELAFEANEPSRVIIDEAIELAKDYGTDSSPRFINGALGKALSHKTRLIHLLANKTGTEAAKITEETSIPELNITDLELSDLLGLLENELAVKLPKANSFETVGDVLTAVEEAL